METDWLPSSCPASNEGGGFADENVPASLQADDNSMEEPILVVNPVEFDAGYNEEAYSSMASYNNGVVDDGAPKGGGGTVMVAADEEMPVVFDMTSELVEMNPDGEISIGLYFMV